MSTQPKKTSGTQKAVKIDDELFYNLDEWLKSDSAKKSGYHSKAQAANEAIGKWLMDKKSTYFQNITIIDNNTIKLNDVRIPIDKDPRVTVTLDDELEWLCDHCNTGNCDHVMTIRVSGQGISLEDRKKRFLKQMQKEYEEEKAYEAADMAGVLNDPDYN